ncbi:hypothetical protein AHAS_Ahas05G0044800 [Arachis hypogaea]
MHTLDTTSVSDAPSLTPASPAPPSIESVLLSSSLDGGDEADSESALYRRKLLFDTSSICSLFIAATACFLRSTTNDSMNATHVQCFISISCPFEVHSLLLRFSAAMYFLGSTLSNCLYSVLLMWRIL